MMTDLIERLRNPHYAKSQTFAESYMREAADEIERLRAQPPTARVDGPIVAWFYESSNGRGSNSKHISFDKPVSNRYRWNIRPLYAGQPTAPVETDIQTLLEIRDFLQDISTGADVTDASRDGATEFVALLDAAYAEKWESSEPETA